MTKIYAKYIVILIEIFALAYIYVLNGLYTHQRSIIYQPDLVIKRPAEYGLSDFSEITIATQDKVALHCWYHPARAGFPTIDYFHGKSGNLSNRIRIYTALASKGFGVLGVSYRGYGASEGKPTEHGLFKDGRASIDYLTAQQQIPLGKIILFGESLGTGVAIKMGGEYHGIGAVIVQSPYTSLAELARSQYPYAPIDLLLEDRFDSVLYVTAVRSPLLVLHGERDNIVPPSEGRAVFAAGNPPKEATFYPDKSHNDFDSNVIAERVLAFATKQHLIPQ